MTDATLRSAIDRAMGPKRPVESRPIPLRQRAIKAAHESGIPTHILPTFHTIALHADLHTGEAILSNKALARGGRAKDERPRISESTAKRHKRWLEDHFVIDVERRYRVGARSPVERNRACILRLRDPSRPHRELRRFAKSMGMPVPEEPAGAPETPATPPAPAPAPAPATPPPKVPVKVEANNSSAAGPLPPGPAFVLEQLRLYKTLARVATAQIASELWEGAMQAEKCEEQIARAIRTVSRRTAGLTRQKLIDRLSTFIDRERAIEAPAPSKPRDLAPIKDPRAEERAKAPEADWLKHIKPPPLRGPPTGSSSN